MALSAGDRLGPYEILGPLGAGGMGEVYRATDTKLDRQVAIKVLPSEVARDRERLSRFEREAKLLAALNHPNVAAIHGLEEAEGQPFLVLELVEGEDLRDRLRRGPFPVAEALTVAKQIAEALEEAHGKGIVHRDLKPANVKLTPDGKVKVLDFGLAKAYAGEASSPILSQSPTEVRGETAVGVILGTAAYMSPEQARGQAVDKRSDIWSFGVLLFEMLTGRRLFAGETLSDTLAAVLEREVDWAGLPSTPPTVGRLLRRCLQRDRNRRLHDIADARLELEDARAEPQGGVPSAHPTTAVRSPLKRGLPWGLAALAAALATGLAAVHFTETLESQRPVHFLLDTPDALERIDAVAVSPDGRHIVLAGGTRDEPPRLWLRSLETPATRPLAGTEGARQPFWSPDGQWIAFFVNRGLERVHLTAGTVQRVCLFPGGKEVVGAGGGGTWNRDGIILFGLGSPFSSIYSVSAEGGEASLLLAPDGSREETGLSSPHFLPDGRRFLLTVWHSIAERDVYVTALESPEERRPVLRHVDTSPSSASGHLVFVRRGSLLAQPLDLDRMELNGVALPIASSGAPSSGGLRVGRISTSASGVVAWQSEAESETQLVWLDRTGGRLGAVGDPARHNQLTLSPDEGRVAVEIRSAEGRYELWVIDVTRGVSSRVTADEAEAELNPVWSPDGRELVFASWREDGRKTLVRIRPGETRSVSVLRESEFENKPETPEDWSPDGTELLYNGEWSASERAVWSLALDSDGKPDSDLVLKKGVMVDEPTISPDGRWLAYLAIDGGDLTASQVHVQPFRRSGQSVRVSPGGGGQPEWRADGQELFYVAPDGQLMAVDFREEDGEPVVGLPVALFQTGDYRPANDSYAVSADGQRFLMKVPVDQDREQRIHVLLNWPSLLQ